MDISPQNIFPKTLRTAKLTGDCFNNRQKKYRTISFLTRVADPHHFNPDPDPVFHFNADPDPAFQFKLFSCLGGHLFKEAPFARNFKEACLAETIMP
jgi:hypothetical protein